MVKVSRKKNLTVMAQARIFTLLSDADSPSGGEDMGMTPHEILESALATCTSITTQMYANRKGWPLESCDTEVQIASEGKETVFAVKVTLRGPLTDEQKQRLNEIAQKCPVHRILSNPIRINVTN